MEYSQTQKKGFKSAFYCKLYIYIYIYILFIYIYSVCMKSCKDQKHFVKSDSLQSNLSIADMLQSGHLIIADNFQWNRPNTVKLSQKNLYIADNCCSGHKFLALLEKFKSNLPLYSEHSIFLWKNKNKLRFNLKMFLFDTLLYFSTSQLHHFYYMQQQCTTIVK